MLVGELFVSSPLSNPFSFRPGEKFYEGSIEDPFILNPNQAISVLVPTWRRPLELTRCLRALAAQSLPPRQVVVTVRQDDAPALAALQALQNQGHAPAGLELVLTDAVPLTEAMNAGLARTNGELVALTDDDAQPHADWLERMAAYFSDPTVGGVGGRDWQPLERWDVQRVGLVCWFGRVIGNHHLGAGSPRDVDLLKGVNCCFRGDELRRIGFDRRLRGRANVSHWEMSLCFAFRRAGWRLVYDPAIGVDHHIAPRYDGDVNARGGFERASYLDAVYNETLAVLEYLPPIRWPIVFAYFLLIGTREAPGLAQVPRLLFQGNPNALGRWWIALQGRFRGLWAHMKQGGHGSQIQMRRADLLRQSETSPSLLPSPPGTSERA